MGSRQTKRWRALKSAFVSASVGLAITVLVAWGSVLFVDWSEATVGSLSSTQRHTDLVDEEFLYAYTLFATNSVAVRRNGHYVMPGVEPFIRTFPATGKASGPGTHHHERERWGNLGPNQKKVEYKYRFHYGEEARGWPMLALWSHAMWYRAGFPPENPAQEDSWVVTGSIILDRTVDGRSQAFKLLPVLPIWRGLIINTLIYALAFQLLLLAARHSRRWNRNRKGLCVACAYDLSGNTSPGCPECGSGRQDEPAAVS